ncbi:uncharacterized protein [Tenebrio molitor]|uniref:uncharacterized protein n=1 Tax=Tenebrio molitor TaxID=7067 RepID=UPI0036248F7A
MNEIPELKDDFAFLKKFDSRSKVWKEIDATFTKGKEKICSNFLLHPKRISSDSECSSSANSPRKFLSETILKNSSLHERNNNVQKHVHHNLTRTCRIISEECFVEKAIGDSVDNNNSVLSTAKTNATFTKKPSKMRPCSSRIENFGKKFMNLLERSIKLLSNIRVMIEEGIPPPDGEEDHMRRTKRLQEFSSRFSRIYLYPLMRQMDELSMPEKLGAAVVNQKFLYAQQMIFQGLQAYYNHLPSSVGKCGSDKLRSLLDQILYLCQLHGLLKKGPNVENNEFINALRNHAELLLEAINNFDLKFVEKKPKPKTSEGNKKKPKMQNKTKSKLSMYAVNASLKKDMELRKAVESLAKKKFTVKSRYKTASFKHRPPIERQKSTNTVPSKIKFFSRNPSDLLKTSPNKAQIREDDIKTMVEMEAELEAPPNTGEILNSIPSSRIQLVQDSDREGVEDGKVEKALEVLRKFLEGSADKKTDFLEKIASEVDKRKEEKPEKSDKPKKKLKDPIVTVTGVKNAKLICIRDDNSVAEADDEYRKKDKEIMTDAEVKLRSSETQTDIKDDKRIRSRSAVKISRLPKATRKMLKLLPKEYAITIIQYKLRYNHFHKHNPMYRKSAHIQPWVLMGQISDEILDYTLQSVTGELEVNEILENLYNAEFQY